ncbi:type IV pilus assembly protein PilB [Desulfobotulus alkaliphilus]|uniref:Type IV pilus assembly protein PilB n=1 Tax=Desulfobotulus alkaliphilus TaxID=622671 RepID=A0A562S5Y6_9BACT|nr:GspE/PulE family protein [Desulfobotulus alkaliphilus]TWI76725.1 type IV pilus assembly protein PilB [Desulfobotulus alkaliphilus]
MIPLYKDRFGGFLVQKGLISQACLERVLSIQKVVPEKIGQLLVREGLLTEDRLMQALSEFTRIPLYDGNGASSVSPEILRLVPEKMARRAGVMPLFRNTKNELLLACNGPVPRAMLQNISRLAKGEVRLVLVTERQLRKLQQLAYAKDVDTRIDFRNQSMDLDDLNLVVELLEKILVRAVSQNNVSDIHFEPEMDGFAIRFREDGMLRRVESLPLAMGQKLTSRIKVLANLDIAERRAPQDGSFVFRPSLLKVEMEAVNMRVSVLPVHYGEKAVIRILPPHDEEIRLNAMGMDSESLEKFSKVLKSPHGLILVTGPTGSGKSTTLYGSLQMLRSERTNITTLEDPVELTLRGINQTQVDGGQRMDFASGLRAILRQDPDIIMVGEIRDAATLQVSLRAAITGHLVLSTLHTNDAPSSFSRLMDMGGESFLVAVSVRAILAQRLVRLVCAHCSEPRPVTRAELDMLGLRHLSPGSFDVKRSSKPCDLCGGKGYAGRTGLYELLLVDEALREKTMHGATSHEIAKVARAGGNYRSLLEDGIEKVKMGLTTPEEILRVTME